MKTLEFIFRNTVNFKIQGFRIEHVQSFLILNLIVYCCVNILFHNAQIHHDILQKQMKIVFVDNMTHGTSNENKIQNRFFCTLTGKRFCLNETSHCFHFNNFAVSNFQSNVLKQVLPKMMSPISFPYSLFCE